jgi:hypothetical protein
MKMRIGDIAASVLQMLSSLAEGITTTRIIVRNLDECIKSKDGRYVIENRTNKKNA